MTYLVAGLIEPVHNPVRRANRSVINRHLHREIYSLNYGGLLYHRFVRPVVTIHA